MKSRRATFIILGFLLIASGLLVALVALPLWQDIQAAQTAEQTTAQLANDLDERRERLAKLASDRSSNQAFADRLEALIPTEQDADGLILRIDTWSSDLSVAASLLTVSETTPTGAAQTGSRLPPGVEGLTFALELTGGFPEVVTLLRQLEDGERLMKLTQVSMNHRTEGGVSARVDGQTVWKPKLTARETNRTYVIDAAQREAFLAPYQSPAFTFPDDPETGRDDPFAAITGSSSGSSSSSSAAPPGGSTPPSSGSSSSGSSGSTTPPSSGGSSGSSGGITPPGF